MPRVKLAAGVVFFVLSFVLFLSVMSSGDGAGVLGFGLLRISGRAGTAFFPWGRRVGTGFIVFTPYFGRLLEGGSC